MFYLFEQNNSGGFFEYNDDLGVGPKIIVEADSHDEAVSIMENIVDFDSTYYCHCCGPRWDRDLRPAEYTSLDRVIKLDVPRSIVTRSSGVVYEDPRRAEVYVHYKNQVVTRINEATKDGDFWVFPMNTVVIW